LQQYAGVYDIEGYNVAVTLQVKNDELWAGVPGQDDSQLIPLSPDTFTVKNKSGYTIHFERDENKLTGFTSTQPDGIFKAHLRK